MSLNSGLGAGTHVSDVALDPWSAARAPDSAHRNMADVPSGALGVLNWQNAEQIFAALDTDGSGEISMQELEAMVIDKGYSIEVAKLLMHELDTDKNGQISLEELKSGLTHSIFAPAKPKPLYNYTVICIGLSYFPVGVAAYAFLEGWYPLDTAYFLMVTSTTVGYGDICPVTRLGRLFTIFYALLGMVVVLAALTPVVELLQTLIDTGEKAFTGFLEKHKFIPPAVNTLDMSLTVQQVNATINYTRRYCVALSNPICMLVLGMLISQGVVDTGDWIDHLYFTIISMTTIGYGDISPKTPLMKVLMVLFLPISVASLAQSITDISAIALRRAIRETDYGEYLAGEFLKANCDKKSDTEKGLTEAEFLVSVLLRRQIVDEVTIAAVRRQFRELVHEDLPGREKIAVENRVYDSVRHYISMLRRGQIRQRPFGIRPGTRADRGKTHLVDMNAPDSGYAEWKKHHWNPELEARWPPRWPSTQAVLDLKLSKTKGARKPVQHAKVPMGRGAGVKNPLSVLISGFLPPILAGPNSDREPEPRNTNGNASANEMI